MEAPSRGGRETRRREYAPGRAPGVVGGPLRYLQGPPGPWRPTWGATAGGGRVAGCESHTHWVLWLFGLAELEHHNQLFSSEIK